MKKITENDNFKMYQFKSISKNGEHSKHIFKVMDDGTTYINQYILSKENYINGFEPLTKRFGKTLHITVIGFKFESLELIYLTAKFQITK